MNECNSSDKYGLMNKLINKSVTRCSQMNIQFVLLVRSNHMSLRKRRIIICLKKGGDVTLE